MKPFLKFAFTIVFISLVINTINTQKKSIKKSSLQPEVKNIQMDLNQLKGNTSKVWQQSLGAGRANERLYLLKITKVGYQSNDVYLVELVKKQYL
jgi:hypothetical protein